MSVNSDTEARLIPLPEVRHRLGDISLEMVYKLARRDEIALVKVGARSFVVSTELDRYIAKVSDRNKDDDYVRQRVLDTCTAQGVALTPEPAVVDVIAALIADRPPTQEATP